MSTTKKRNLYFTKKKDIAYYRSKAGTNPLITAAHPVSIVGKQETTSTSNPYWRLRRQYGKKNSYYAANSSKEFLRYIQKLDIGSPFQTITHEYEEKPNERWIKYYAWNAFGPSWSEYFGPLKAVVASIGPTSGYWPVLPAFDQFLADQTGATAIARVLPTNPISGLAVFLGELREQFPSVIGKSFFTRAGFFKNLGSEYLNVEFGWKPFISDLQKFANAAKTCERVLKQYERDSGRGVRRRYSFDPVITTTVTDTGSRTPQPPMAASMYLNTGYAPSTKTRVTKTEYWFSGCFTYYLERGQSDLEKAIRFEQEANKLLGTRITPDVLWELAPWSWAIDWASNTGDVLQNVSAFANDGLVMRYGYLMCRETIEDTYTLGALTLKDGQRIGPLTQTFRTVRKTRVKATPYGFGVNLTTLTPRQIAIIVALGLTKT